MSVRIIQAVCQAKGDDDEGPRETDEIEDAGGDGCDADDDDDDDDDG